MGEPNKPPLEIDGEASIAYARLRNGEKAEDIAADMRIGRATFYRRVDRFARMHDQPTQTLRRLLAEADLDRLTESARELFAGDGALDAKVKLLSELRALNQSKRKLYGVDEVPAPAGMPEVDPDPEVEDWVRAAAAEAEADLRKVRNGDSAP